MSDYKPEISKVAIGAITALATFFFGGRLKRKKDQAELVEKIQAIYKDMMSDTEQRMDGFRKEIDSLKKEQNELNSQWKKKLLQVERKWQTKYSRLKTKYDKLFKDFEDYREAHK